MGAPYDNLQLVDREQLQECLGWRVREQGPSNFEYLAAEFYIRELYHVYFRQLPKPQTITWDLERFFNGYETGDPIIELALETLETDFRNTFSDSFVRRFKRAIAKDEHFGVLHQLMREASGGGARKPDMLGIYADSTRLAFDAVEVGTVKTAKETYDELNGKLGQIREPVIKIIRLKMEVLLRKYYSKGRNISAPQDYRAAASAFRPKRHQWILPLPIRIGGGGSARYADWICFHPSKTWRPKSYPDANSLPEALTRPGTDGLLIYHIHRAALPNLPDPVKRAVREQLLKWRYEHGLTLELNPSLAMSMKSSAALWSPEATYFFAVLGAGAALLLFMSVAWEVGLVAGAAEIAEGGLVTLAESPALLLRAISSATQLAQQIWPAAIGVTPFVPHYR